ncbi:MAG: HBL/NHE enterotoxin family protein [Sulfuricurvum sp.]|jgi:hypothetical protein|uniref:HBL/NHE enterotoxin family protein n=1 Tax=Sulfuricurvum sp. TaxID=2025608 RepID=UPI0025F1FDE3|nr:HBL/NHE enterotoxin family protein [Sulfuricurvum sp.]MCK9371907.1 HBL/NHE enterotoxin family protein [Sulfuricurvum sp.]
MSAQKKRFFPFALASNVQNISLASLQHIPSATLVAANNVEDTIPIEQQLVNAFNANNDVMSYVLGITQTTLPTIPAPIPSWYPPFQTAFSNAQIHANGWYSIATNLVSIPNAISGYGIAFNSNMSTINSLIGVLLADPTNAAAIAQLQKILNGMISQIKGYSQTAVTFQQNILDFSNNLTADSAIMSKAVADSLSTIGVDQAQIQKLEDDIASLQEQIKTWQTVMTVAGLAAGIGFFAGAVIAVFTFGFGLAFGIVSAIAGIATMIAASVEISNLTNEVNKDTAEMNALTQQVASLKLLNTQLDALIVLSEAAGTQVDLILEVWSELESEINTVLTDLQNCQGDTTPLNLGQLQTDLNMANQDWQTLVGLCNTISSITYNQATPLTANLQ